MEARDIYRLKRKPSPDAVSFQHVALEAVWRRKMRRSLKCTSRREATSVRVKSAVVLVDAHFIIHFHIGEYRKSREENISKRRPRVDCYVATESMFSILQLMPPAFSVIDKMHDGYTTRYYNTAIR